MTCYGFFRPPVTKVRPKVYSSPGGLDCLKLVFSAAYTFAAGSDSATVSGQFRTKRSTNGLGCPRDKDALAVASSLKSVASRAMSASVLLSMSEARHPSVREVQLCF